MAGQGGTCLWSQNLEVEAEGSGVQVQLQLKITAQWPGWAVGDSVWNNKQCQETIIINTACLIEAPSAFVWKWCSVLLQREAEGRAWWHLPSQQLEAQASRSLSSRGELVLHSESQDSRNYTQKPCLNKSYQNASSWKGPAAFGRQKKEAT